MTGTRLNDCTPAPDEQARYADGVTDEREAALQTFARMNEALARVTDERDAALAEIARLRAPPEADVMEIARVTLGYTADPAWIINDPQRFPDVHSVAQALTAYGDQRAREAVEQRVLAGWGPPIGASPNEHKNALTAHGDQRAREAGLTDSQIHDFWQAIEKNKG